MLPWWLLRTTAGCDEYMRLWLPDCPAEMFASAWCTVAFALGYCFTVLVWQDLCWVKSRFGPPHVAAGAFLDKLCVHQTDEDRKRRGIESFGGFLIDSDEMVVLWDSTYLTRLWCVFEIATFLSLNEQGFFSIVPIALYAAEFYVTIFSICTYISFMVLLATGTLGYVADLFARFAGAPDMLTVFLTTAIAFWPLCTGAMWAWRSFARSRHQIASQMQEFSLRTSDCFDDRDREYVSAIVAGIYGSESEFEEFARQVLKNKFHRSLGPTFRLPVGFIFRASCVPLFMCMLDVVFCFRDGSSEFRLRGIFWALALALLHLPVIITCVERIASLNLGTKSRPEEALLLILLGSTSAVLFGAWTASASLSGHSAQNLAISGICGVCANVLCRPGALPWIVSSLRRWRSRLARDTPQEPESAEAGAAAENQLAETNAVDASDDSDMRAEDLGSAFELGIVPGAGEDSRCEGSI